MKAPEKQEIHYICF